MVSSGLSGTLVTSSIFYEFGIPNIHVRKVGEESHGKTIQGIVKRDMRYVIVDDLISTGTTIKNMLWKMEELEVKAICEAIILYFDTVPPSSFEYQGKSIPIFRV